MQIRYQAGKRQPSFVTTASHFWVRYAVSSSRFQDARRRGDEGKNEGFFLGACECVSLCCTYIRAGSGIGGARADTVAARVGACADVVVLAGRSIGQGL